MPDADFECLAVRCDSVQLKRLFDEQLAAKARRRWSLAAQSIEEKILFSSGCRNSPAPWRRQQDAPPGGPGNSSSRAAGATALRSYT